MSRARVVLGLALGLAAAGCQSAPAPPPFQPTADVKQLMAQMIEPAAEHYWDAVGWIVDSEGTHEVEPATAEDWEAVRNAALVVTESGNLLMMSPRAQDGGEWMQLSRSMIAAGQNAIRAAEARDKMAVFDRGAELYETCTACHAKYSPQIMRPNAR